MSDPVNHPSHYDNGNEPECIEFTRHMSFNAGNAFKYLYRYGTKEGVKWIQDHDKAIWYLTDEVARLEVIKTNWFLTKAYDIAMRFKKNEINADPYELDIARSMLALRPMYLIVESHAASLDSRIVVLTNIRNGLVDVRSRHKQG